MHSDQSHKKNYAVYTASIYSMTRASPGPVLQQLHLQSGPDLNPKFDTITAPNTLYAGHDSYKSHASSF